MKIRFVNVLRWILDAILSKIVKDYPRKKV